jgi:hypothetical protein
MSDHILDPPTQIYTLNHKNSSELLLKLLYMFHTYVGWGPWHAISEWTPNVCHSEKDAVDQVILILCFHSVNILFNASP